MMITTFSLKLLEAQTIAPGVKHFKFSCNDQASFAYIPGQFITLHIPSTENKQVLRRSYSIASIRGIDETIDFAASYIAQGPASTFLFALNPGDEVTASGPSGRLILRAEDQPRRYLLLATGTGITPYR